MSAEEVRRAVLAFVREMEAAGCRVRYSCISPLGADTHSITIAIRSAFATQAGDDEADARARFSGVAQ